MNLLCIYNVFKKYERLEIWYTTCLFSVPILVISCFFRKNLRPIFIKCYKTYQQNKDGFCCSYYEFREKTEQQIAEKRFSSYLNTSFIRLNIALNAHLTFTLAFAAWRITNTCSLWHSSAFHFSAH